MNIIKEISDLGFTCYLDENKMNNFISQNQKDVDIVFLEEYRRGNYEKGYGVTKETYFTLYIYNSGNGKPKTANEREIIRERLEENIIKPIINKLADNISDITFTIGPSRYNSIETGIQLNFTYKEEVCND